jgi:hypothetical protein
MNLLLSFLQRKRKRLVLLAPLLAVLLNRSDSQHCLHLAEEIGKASLFCYGLRESFFGAVIHQRVPLVQQENHPDLTRVVVLKDLFDRNKVLKRL